MGELRIVNDGKGGLFQEISNLLQALANCTLHTHLQNLTKDQDINIYIFYHKSIHGIKRRNYFEIWSLGRLEDCGLIRPQT